MSASPKAERKPRADAERNRERLMAAATDGFAETGSNVSLDEIARRAGVGIGTLYRHFRTRDALVEAVYRHEVEQLAGAATRLAANRPPFEALHEWMRLFVDYISAKKVIAAALTTLPDTNSELYVASGLRIYEAIGRLVDRAVAAGAIRPDTNAKDLLRALVGFTYGAGGPDWAPSARRLIDILMDGLKPAR